MMIATASAETAGDVILGQLMARVGEDPFGGADLDQVAQMKVRGAL